MDSVHSADVDYADLLASMFAMNTGHFLMQLARSTAVATCQPGP